MRPPMQEEPNDEDVELTNTPGGVAGLAVGAARDIATGRCSWPRTWLYVSHAASVVVGFVATIAFQRLVFAEYTCKHMCDCDV